MNQIGAMPVHTTGHTVVVTNLETGESVTYGSKKAAAAAMKADETTFKPNRTRPFRKIYDIKVLSNS